VRVERCTYTTHHLPLEQAPYTYEFFQKKEGKVSKVQLQPEGDGCDQAC
jgi:hypothetical protein